MLYASSKDRFKRELDGTKAAMEAETLTLVIVGALSLLLIAAIRKRRQSSAHSHQSPPGPRFYRLVIHFFQKIGPDFTTHSFLSYLGDRYGPVMTVPLGPMTAVVISTADAAREMFKQHDLAISDRMVFESMKVSSGSEGTIIAAPMGAKWRMLRRLWAFQFFTTARLDSFEGVRRGCINSLAINIEETGKLGSRPVDLRRAFFMMAFNHLGYIVLSRSLLESNSEEGTKFYYHSRQIMKLVGKLNVADYVPFFRRFDPQGIRKNMDVQVWAGLRIMAGFVEERQMMIKEGAHDTNGPKKDFLDVLLEFRGDGVDEPVELSVQAITNIILEVFMAGSDTSTNTLEWTMAELLNNPEVLKKVQAEIRQHVDATDLSEMKDRDFLNLPYLNAVVKEALRLHPPLPLLVPRKASKAYDLHGYHIPKGTQILVNVWKLGRDRNVWADPLAFRPERFMEEASPEYKGQNFEYIPFGSGRRICPAIPLMTRMLPLVLGRLLYSFDWALPDGQAAEDMDMAEMAGIASAKAIPLHAMAVPYKSPSLAAA